MSWLSKLVGGKTLKIAALAGAGYFGSRYLFGEQNLGGYGGAGDYVGASYTDDTFAGRVFNKFNITPFQSTSF